MNILRISKEAKIMNNGKPPRQSTKMTLKEYFSALGHLSRYRLVQATGVPDDVIRTALKGDPIAQTYAEKIAQYFSKEFGRDVQLVDIKELTVVNPGSRRAT
jgi:hypothetical protein